MLPVTVDRPIADGPNPRPRWWRYEGVRRPAVDRPHAAGAPTRFSHPAWEAAAPAERSLAVAVVALMVVYGPGLGIGQWSVENAAAVAIGLAGVPLLLARLLPGSRRTRWERAAAALLVAWLAVALISALHSSRPVLSIVGSYNQSEGWLLDVVLGAFWAFGVALRSTGRALLGSALVVGGVANSTVAVLQVLVGLARFGLPLHDGQADGFQGNPVFLGGIAAAGAVLVLVRAFERGATRRDLALVAVLAAGAGISAERMSALVVLVAAGAMALATRFRRGASPSPRSADVGAERRWWGRGVPDVLATAAAVAGLVGGAALPVLRHTTSVATKLGASAEGTFGDRLHAWLEGLRAIGHQPLLGAGPGRFQAATSSLFPLWFDRANANQVFGDAHNLVVEVAVTTGVLGLGALTAWAAVSVPRCRGPLLGFAAAALAVELVEPLNPVLTPLLFLAFGAAAGAGRDRMRGRAGSAPDVRDTTFPVATAPEPGGAAARTRARVVTAAMAAAAIVGVLLATDLVVGSRLMVDSGNAVMATGERRALADATAANRMLSPWPQSAGAMAFVVAFGRSAPGAPTPLAQAAAWEQVAAARDPMDGPAWASAAQTQLQLGRLGRAAADAAQARRSMPWNASALQILGTVALDRGDVPMARRWFSRLVQVQPRPALSQLLQRSCAEQEASLAAVPGAGDGC